MHSKFVPVVTYERAIRLSPTSRGFLLTGYTVSSSGGCGCCAWSTVASTNLAAWPEETENFRQLHILLGSWRAGAAFQIWPASPN